MRCFEEISVLKSRIYVEQEEKIATISAKSKDDPMVEQFIEAIKKVKPEVLSKLVAILDINHSLGDNKGISFLHIAATSTDSKVLEWLLENGADPTRKGEKLPTLPYDAAVSKECRNVFRKFMAKYPAKWDYSLTNIPSPLTEEMEELAKRREREKRKREREKKKAQKILNAPVVVGDSGPVVNSTAAKFKNLSLAGLKKSDKELLGMSADQRMRLDREKRAMAAESRLRSQKNECGNCGISLTGLASFDKSVYRYCSIDCLKVLASLSQENQILF
jgi:hypothetical protein